MGKGVDNGLNWGNVDPAYLVEWLNEVSDRDGTITFMFGGYGNYYKVAWKIDGVSGFASAESAERLVRCVYERLLGAR